MVWLNSSPTLLVPLVDPETPLVARCMPHAPLIVILTESAVLIYHQHTFLPLASHRRTKDSLYQHGYNANFRIQDISVNTSKLQQSTHVNLIVQTTTSYLVVFQINISYSKSMFLILDAKTDETLQAGLPLITTQSLFSLANILKSATRSIIAGHDATSNLENIEHFNNSNAEDELNNFAVPHVKISIFRILKISIGLSDFWLKHNSHNLFVYHSNDLQIINLKTFVNEVYLLDDLDWYVSKSPVHIMKYNEYFNYFLFVNSDNEIWYMTFNSEKELIGHKVSDLEIKIVSNSMSFHFNPQFNLVLVSTDKGLLLYRTESMEDTARFTFIKRMQLDPNHSQEVSTETINVNWSPCGEFFTSIHGSTWRIYSKFGNCYFNSKEILKELNTTANDTKKLVDFLKVSHVLVPSNSRNIVVIDSNNESMYLLEILNNSTTHHDKYNPTLVLTNSEYLNVLVESKQTIAKFPILPLFKSIMRQIQVVNQPPKSHKCLNGKLTISSNIYHQMSISYGDKISISTPFMTEGGDINHTLWFNFHDYLQETLNIINHFWFQDYLVLVNRNFVKLEVNEVERLTDELLILDTSPSKYGHGGNGYKFNSDSIIWRYNLDQCVLAYDISCFNGNQDQLVVITNEYKIIMFNISKYDLVKHKGSNNSKIFVGMNKTINLKLILNKLSIQNISLIKLVEGRHFLILLNTGEFCILKSLGENSNVYDLIMINNCVEFFRLKTLYDEFLYLSTGSSILIYKLTDITNCSGKVMVHPIVIKNDDYFFQPLILNVTHNDKKNKSINLIGFETFSFSRNKHLTLKTRINYKLILNDFIEFDLVNNNKDLSIFDKYKEYSNFQYCLELLLFKHLTNIDDDIQSDADGKVLKILIQLIDKQEGASEFIYINCLRKIEVGYWYKFFDTLETTPLKFMNKLISMGQVELCYNYLIIYLNFKKEYEAPTKKTESLLDDQDQTIILKIIKMLDSAERWDWCFELCRFIKLLEPSSELLRKVKKQVEVLNK